MLADTSTIISAIEIFRSIVYILIYISFISNSTQKQCLTIDAHDINNLGPAKFKAQADSNTEQICYCNRSKKETSFNSFLTLRKETSSASEIKLSIVKAIDIQKDKTLYILK